MLPWIAFNEIYSCGKKGEDKHKKETPTGSPVTFGDKIY
jgi:hypothetical protein